MSARFQNLATAPHLRGAACGTEEKALAPVALRAWRARLPLLRGQVRAGRDTPPARASPYVLKCGAPGAGNHSAESPMQPSTDK